MRGYTLIELLITITITVLLITFGVNAYRKAAELQAIKSQAETLLTLLNQAQKAATTGKTDCVGSIYLGEQITFVANQKTITTTSTCRGGNNGSPRQITLSDLYPTSSQTITFRPGNQGVEFPGGSSLNLDFTTGTTTYRFEITRSGNIKYLGKL